MNAPAKKTDIGLDVRRCPLCGSPLSFRDARPFWFCRCMRDQAVDRKIPLVWRHRKRSHKC